MKRPLLHTRKISAVAVMLVAALFMSGCYVNQNNIAASDKVQPGAPVNFGLVTKNVSYGSLAQQKLDIYRPKGTAVGTIVYMHSGGWIAGDRTAVSDFVMSQVNRGWAVVSVEYRLAPAVRAPQIVADVDRAFRYVKANATSLKLNVSTIISSGASAGGHLALLAGYAPGVASVDPTLPARLKATSPSVNGVVSLVGPTDLRTLWQAGGWAPGLQEAFLGCLMPNCNQDLVNRYSPTVYVALWNYLNPAGANIAPGYLGYGALDTLVTVATQGNSLYEQLAASGRDAKIYYDIPPNGGHNLDYFLNKTAFASWLDKVKNRQF